MKDQVSYYNQFGKLYAQDILDCPEPELWTTDYRQQGPVFREMKERLALQEAFIMKYFKKEFPVLDIGCGFGRQATWLAKEGFQVTGTDSSEVFIEIAQQLFNKNNYKGEFFATELLRFTGGNKYRQVLLLDVLEHFPPRTRQKTISHINSLMIKNGVLILSVPHVRKRFSSFINNQVLKKIKGQFSYFRNREEHPFTIPGKSSLLNLAAPFFILEEFLETTQTDYYIFRKN